MSNLQSGRNFVIVGTGNLALHLGKALKEKGYSLLQVVGRDSIKTKKFAQNFRAVSFTTKISQITKDADIYFFCVNDDQLEALAKKIDLKGKLIVHCSGSVPMSVLQPASSHYGVMYPLYTFSGEDKQVDFLEVPVFIEGATLLARKKIQSIACDLSSKVRLLNSDKRKKLHLAAVMSANFSNLLYQLSNEYLQKEKAGRFSDLLPLLRKTIDKLELHSPHKVQTGPASRKDKQTISKHLNLLKNHKGHQKIYRMLSAAIESRS